MLFQLRNTIHVVEGGRAMTYLGAVRFIENSSWYREIIERDRCATLVELPRQRFDRELQAIIARHARQQVHIDRIKQSCRVKA